MASGSKVGVEFVAILLLNAALVSLRDGWEDAEFDARFERDGSTVYGLEGPATGAWLSSSRRSTSITSGCLLFVGTAVWWEAFCSNLSSISGVRPSCSAKDLANASSLSRAVRSETAGVMLEDNLAFPLPEPAPVIHFCPGLLKKLSRLDCWPVSTFGFFLRGVDGLPVVRLRFMSGSDKALVG